jgi:hypothetical protein
LRESGALHFDAGGAMGIVLPGWAEDMAGEPISSEAAAGWSRRNVADVAVALIGFGVAVSAVEWLMNSVSEILLARLSGFAQNSYKLILPRTCESAFLCLFLGLWLIAHHRKISTRLFRAAAGVPVSERRAALAFGIKVYAVYLAALVATWLAHAMSTEIWRAVMSAGHRDPVMLLYSLTYPLTYLPEIAVCLYFLRRPGWLVSFAYPEGEPNEDA